MTTNCTVDATFSVALALVAVQSRKTHGGTTDFDLVIDRNQAIDQLITVEPRMVGSGHRIVFQFSGPVMSVGGASVSPVGTATPSFSGTEVTVTLTGIADNQRVTVSLTNVNGSTPAQASLGFLVGDVNSSRSVNSSDISAVKARVGQTANLTNFRFDVNASGSINAVDTSAVKARAGMVLPP